MKLNSSLLGLTLMGFLGSVEAKEVRLEDLPAPVRETIQKESRDGKIDEIEAKADATGTIYIAEIDLPRDRDLKIYVAANGTLLKAWEDVALEEAPVAVREAVAKLIPADGTLDDIDKVIENGAVSYHVEIDRKGAKDLKAVISEDGKVLSQRED